MPEYQILVPPPRRHRRAWTTVIVVVIVVAVAAGAFVVGRHVEDSRHASKDHGGGKTGSVAKPFAVSSTVPASGATDVASNQVVTVHLSAPVAGTGGMPTFDPPVAGSWKRTGPTSLSFVATAPFLPMSTETLSIEAGPSGPHSVTGQVLATPDAITFTVAQASTERLQQLLAQLNYLPLAFTRPHRSRRPSTPSPRRRAPSRGGGPTPRRR